MGGDVAEAVALIKDDGWEELNSGIRISFGYSDELSDEGKEAINDVSESIAYTIQAYVKSALEDLIDEINDNSSLGEHSIDIDDIISGADDYEDQINEDSKGATGLGGIRGAFGYKYSNEDSVNESINDVSHPISVEINDYFRGRLSALIDEINDSLITHEIDVDDIIAGGDLVEIESDHDYVSFYQTVRATFGYSDDMDDTSKDAISDISSSFVNAINDYIYSKFKSLIDEINDPDQTVHDIKISDIF